MFVKIESTWSRKQGWLILLSFLVLYALFSALHVQIVKLGIGFENYLGEGDQLPPHVLILGQVIKAGSIGIVIYFLGLKYYKIDKSAIKLVNCAFKYYWWAVLLALLSFAFRLWLMKSIATEMPDWARMMRPVFDWRTSSWLMIVTILVMTIIITPIAEEVFFRGFLFPWMCQARPVWLAMLASSLMFGVSHIIPPQVISAFIGSFFILFLLMKSGSLYPCIVCHIVGNGLGLGLELFVK
jgi:membrane protease YdiL (CAAX protease family)